MAILGVIGFSLAQTIQHYYVDYPKSVNTDIYWTRYTDLAYYAALVPSWSHLILYDEGDLLLDYSTVRFLAPHLDGIRVQTPAALRQALSARTGPVVVLIPATNAASYKRMLAMPGMLPPGSLQAVRDSFGVTAFYTYTVP